MEEAPDCEEHVGLFWIAASFNPWAALRVELMFYSTCNQGERVWLLGQVGRMLGREFATADKSHWPIKACWYQISSFPNDALMNSAISLPWLWDTAEYNFGLLKDVFISWNADGGENENAPQKFSSRHFLQRLRNARVHPAFRSRQPARTIHVQLKPISSHSPHLKWKVIVTFVLDVCGEQLWKMAAWTTLLPKRLRTLLPPQFNPHWMAFSR